MTNETTDRTLQAFRAQITELDREIVAAVNPDALPLPVEWDG